MASRGTAARDVFGGGRWRSCIGIPALVLGLAAAPVAAQGTDRDSLPVLIRQRVEAAPADGLLRAGDRLLTATRAIPAFYGARGFRPAWIERGRPATGLATLVQAIQGAALDGLDPADYHLDRIRTLTRMGAMAADPERVELELLATDAFLVLSSHLLHGRIDPVSLQANWSADRRGKDMAAVLAEALEGGDVAAALDRLRPGERRYRQMRQALVGLRETERAGGWPVVGEGPTLRAGDRAPRVAAVRTRLEASGDLEPVPWDDPALFDPALESAVRRFQERHGLEPDGAVGAATRAALAVPVATRIRQVVVNLERWRWMPPELGRRHLVVNIPDFHVTAWEDGEPVLRLRAIVGGEYRQTPVFSDRVTRIVFAPVWNVPRGIAARDKLPLIRQDPSYLAAQHMTLLDRRTERAVDPATVDWSSITAAGFTERYRLRQAPGPMNALGRVKFLFPNRFNVYLHDTPSRELFDRNQRTFSSGCIRVERPLELAALLLRPRPDWTGERIRRAAAGRTETAVVLSDPVPIHIQYWTAFIDEEGRLNHRHDVYRRDPAILAALVAGRP